MAGTDMTALTDQFTAAIGDLKAPVLAIMGAGVAITLLLVAFNLLKKVFRHSTN
jgi:hypothetical protein